jgi:putative Holliday junction resolvase
MRYLGIDYGLKRVGVAISNETASLAFPERVLPNTKYLVETIKILCEEKAVSGIVIGESKNYQGEDNPLMRNIRRLKDLLIKETGLPVYLEPEFLTSAEAARVTGRNSMNDAAAAAIILQSFLDRRIRRTRKEEGDIINE